MKHLLLASIGLVGLTSCEMTGDPSAGGLFGWSQSMSNERIASREAYRDDIQRDTAAKRAEARRLQNQMNH